jgi:glycerol-3-phosphate dehydrogenase
MEALHERGLLRRNAPHLVHDLGFVVPNYAWWETPFYGIGMKVYDLLAGKYGFGRSRILGRDEVLGHIPNLEQDGLRGGVLYFDGQFDDARLLVSLVRTAIDHGATLLNYCRVERLIKDSDDCVCGARACDLETGREAEPRARIVINATGAFSDHVRRMDDLTAPRMIAPSQGVHLMLDGSFLKGNTAIMVPRTGDGRVMFAIPWHGHTLVGTTDTPVEAASLEPVPLDEEIDFILDTAAGYLQRDPTRADVRSAFAGIRPLVRADGVSGTATLARDHTIHVSSSGLLSIAGGKWTTYRKMAEDCVDHAITLARLTERACVTRSLPVHGAVAEVDRDDPLWVYGRDADAIRALARDEPLLSERLHARLPVIAAQVVFAARFEMARTVEDVLARRTRVLQLDARAALEMAPRVAELLARELQRDEVWQREQVRDFTTLAHGYLVRAG